MDRSWSLAGGHGHGTPQGQPGHRDQALGGWLVEPRPLWSRPKVSSR
jgi:hypothetical protein